ncbi:hypothetical protein L9F63_005204, partial [Diploptera punctata]
NLGDIPSTLMIVKKVNFSMTSLNKLKSSSVLEVEAELLNTMTNHNTVRQ